MTKTVATTQTSVTTAIFANACVHLLVYVIEAASGYDIDVTAETAATTILTALALYFLPANFPMRTSDK